MIIVDTHCDTLTKIMELNENIKNNSCHIDLNRLAKLGDFVQMFAAFIEPDFYGANAMKRAIQIIDRCYKEFKTHSNDIMLCRNYNDILDSISQNKIAGILSIEGGEALQGDISALGIFYELGVRSICLTWNFKNEIAVGVEDGLTSTDGLSQFGIEVVKEMNRLGMIIDVSHLSEYGFWDVVKLSKLPIIASHSNSKSICSNKRNLTDKQILSIKGLNGVIGINLYSDFLNDTKDVNIDNIIKHIEYIVSLTGFNHIGIGADFDGVDKLPIGINGVEDLYKIFNKLGSLNYPDEFINKFSGDNFLRVFKEILK